MGLNLHLRLTRRCSRIDHFSDALIFSSMIGGEGAGDFHDRPKLAMNKFSLARV